MEDLEILLSFFKIEDYELPIMVKHLVLADVPQVCILVPSFFLIYIKDLLDALFSNRKLFPGNTYLFSAAPYKNFPGKATIMTYRKLVTKSTSGKCSSTLILLSKYMR